MPKGEAGIVNDIDLLTAGQVVQLRKDAPLVISREPNAGVEPPVDSGPPLNK